MRRREFISALGGAAALWPRAVGAQRATKPVIGFIINQSLDKGADILAGFRQGLEETGYIEDKNVAVAYRSTEGHYDRLPAIVDELVYLKVAVIVAGGNLAATVANRGTQAIPIVFVVAADPVKLGLVQSLGRPDRKATGITALTASLTLKRLELMSEFVPRASAIGFLVNPDNEDILVDVQNAADSFGQKVFVARARALDDLEGAFASFSKAHVGGLLVANDAFFLSQRERLIELATRHVLPAIYEFPEFPKDGGLMSYGPDLRDMFRLLGVYAGRILSGAKPADLPVEQPKKFELVVNLKTAKSLGLTIPESFLLRADQVIE